MNQTAAGEAPVDQGVGRPVPEIDQGAALGVHWLGGRPYMLTSDAPAPKNLDGRLKTRSQRMRDAGFTRRPSAKSLPSDE